MSGTYLVCDLCGKFGPPAAFIGKDGMRLCYECAYNDEVENKKTLQEEKSQNKGNNHDIDQPSDINQSSS